MLEFNDNSNLSAAGSLAIFDESGAEMVRFTLPVTNGAVGFEECLVRGTRELLTTQNITDEKMSDEAYMLAVTNELIRCFLDVIFRCQVGHANLQSSLDSLNTENFDG